MIVHYNSSHDEWRDETEFVLIDSHPSEHSIEIHCNGTMYAPFSFYSKPGYSVHQILGLTHHAMSRSPPELTEQLKSGYH